ncbi:ribosomal protein S18 [Daldinia sp. FL1419]|nr:ribosomal protein S18 [Daldinia sp. FL1419]
MAPRISLPAALRQASTLFKSQSASISSTSSREAIRRDIPSVTSNLLDIDDSTPQRGPRERDPTRAAADIYDRLRHTVARRVHIEEEMRQSIKNDDYLRQLTRRWRPGDVYAPHDMSSSEMNKWRRTQARKRDLVDVLGLRPLDMYRNFSVVSEYMTPHGRIKRSVDTGLRPVNQRKMAKAVRRAIGLGIHPSVHHHPEILIRQNARYYEQTTATVNRNVRGSGI